MVLAAVLVTGAASARRAAVPASGVEVVVTMHAPPLVRAVRTFDRTSPASKAYLARLTAAQDRLATRIVRAIPSAEVRWRYRLLLDGMAVVVHPRDVARLRRVPGVADVYPSVAYRPRLEPSLTMIGAPAVWGAGLDTAGQGMKIGIIDDGVDQRHPFFSPAGYTMPAGFPKGQVAYTTAKVIAARAFPPPHSTHAGAALPFDTSLSEHGTHVAGIAAGNAHTTAGTIPDLSGVAPAAYIGNYKVLGTPTPSVGPDGNSAEIVAGIEAAVADGMDVINLSLGEPEIEPSRDIVTQALDAAAAAGVVPVVAAGNDRAEFGNGSVDSPGSAAKAITAAAVDFSGRPASFSSAGPAPVSLRMKPDVAAPGVGVASSVPASHGTWARFSGTSMASPHVAGAVAVLLQRHPTWKVADVKSALVQTGNPARSGSRESPTTQEGGGIIFLPRADDPKLFASPTGLSFGLLKRGAKPTQTVKLADAGGGAGAWSAVVQQQSSTAGVAVKVPASVTVPGSFAVRVTVGARAAERDLTGFVVLTKGSDRRRIPYWFRIEAPKLGSAPHGTLARNGTYAGNTAGRANRVSLYRYPDNPSGLGMTRVLAGPEQVFRVTLRRPVANFGVAILTRGSTRVRVEPRVVVAGDENRLTGYAGLPFNLNPYLPNFSVLQPVAGAIRPKAGKYDIVFDSSSRPTAGRFTFRFWIDDNTPPRVRLLTPSVASGGAIRLAIGDAGSAVDPSSLTATIDGSEARIAYAAGRATVRATALSPGSHRLVVHASDYQETKNMEDVAAILPNTRVLSTTVTVR